MSVQQGDSSKIFDLFEYDRARALAIPNYYLMGSLVVGAGNILQILFRENLFKQVTPPDEMGLLVTWDTSAYEQSGGIDNRDNSGPEFPGATPINSEPPAKGTGLTPPHGGLNIEGFAGELVPSSPGPVANSQWLEFRWQYIKLPLSDAGPGANQWHVIDLPAAMDYAKIHLYLDPAPFTPSDPSNAEIILKAAIKVNCQGNNFSKRE